MDELLERQAGLLATMIEASLNSGLAQPKTAFILVLIELSEPPQGNVVVSNTQNTTAILEMLKGVVKHLEREITEH
jgi:hypothetical protein